jgi:hypothetical protein
MTMQGMGSELEQWQRQWQSLEAAVPPDLATAVEAGSRNIRRGVMAEVVTTVVMGGGVTAWALAAPRTEMTVLAIAVWIFIAIAWTASTLLRRGIWQPVTSTTSAFVDISILRCQRNLQAIWAQAGLYVVILVFDLVWLYYYHAETSVAEFLMRPQLLLFLVVVTSILAAAAMWYRRRLLRELENLLTLRRAG